jgi:hypothetical protein
VIREVKLVIPNEYFGEPQPSGASTAPRSLSFIKKSDQPFQFVKLYKFCSLS